MRKYIPRNDNVPGFCYLIEAKNSDGLYKIGLTRNPDRRIEQLNSSQSPYHLDYVKLIEVDDMASVESSLHQQFKACGSGKNEWFRFSPNQVNQVVKVMEQLEHGASNQYRFPDWLNLPSIRFNKPLEAIALTILGCLTVWAIAAPRRHSPGISQAAIAANSSAPRCVVAVPLLNIRAGAGINYPISGKPLSSGTVVEKLGQTSGWIRSSQGWIASNHLRCENGQPH